MSTAAPGQSPGSLIREMRESDLSTAASIVRLAFGTFLGVSDPNSFAADKEYVATRWKVNPSAALVGEVDGALAGSNFATRWGSFAFFGPLTVRPELWNRGVAQSLLEATMDLFNAWGVKEAGLFTFAQSAKHVHLYQKFGFWPRFLTAIMEKPAISPSSGSWSKFSELNDDSRREALEACCALTGSVFEGLDVTSEIHSVLDQQLGETLLIWDGDTLDAFAVCHCGAGTEAGSGVCYVKFGAARPGKHVERSFGQLLGASEALAVERGLKRVEAGINLGRARAYRQMLEHGFRTQIQGVAMHKPDSPGYNRPDVHVLDDWR